MENDPLIDTMSYYGTLAIGTLGMAAMCKDRPVLGAVAGFTIPWLMLNKPPVTRIVKSSLPVSDTTTTTTAVTTGTEAGHNGTIRNGVTRSRVGGKPMGENDEQYE